MNPFKYNRRRSQGRRLKTLHYLGMSHPKNLFAIIAILLSTIFYPFNTWAGEIIAEHDAYVYALYPTNNYGNKTFFRARKNGDEMITYLRFDAPAAAIGNAIIHVYVESGSASLTIHHVNDNTWTESTLDYSNKPSYNTQAITSATPSGVDWVQFDVSSEITAAGTYSFAVQTSGSQVKMTSSEGANKPKLAFTEPIKLPIEVLGNPTPGNPVEESITFEIGSGNDIVDINAIKKLRILAHRIGFLHWHSPLAPQDPTGTQTAKAAVVINGDEQNKVELTNNNAKVSVDDQAYNYGGIGGGFMTMELDIDIDDQAFVLGTNTITFQFLQTDDISSGFRIIDLNLLGTGSQKLLPDSRLLEEDPAERTEGLNSIDNASSANGKDLWEGENSSPVLTDPRWGDLNSTCSDCHARDGRDLKYYHYSNQSIIARSIFHGLTESQGKDIAAYIRSLDIGIPDNDPSIKTEARPWNPPYQPGTVLSNGNLNAGTAYWAAGAGFKRVLKHDSHMLTYFENLGNWDDIASTWSTLNVRKMPIAIQLPDWNAWLPAIHPKDIWGGNNTDYQDGYDEFRDYLEDNAQSGYTEDIFDEFRNVDAKVRGFISKNRTDSVGHGNWRTFESDNITENILIDNGNYQIHRESAKLALAKWLAVKSWELVQEFDLESLPQTLRPQAAITHNIHGGLLVKRGETKSWPTLGQSTWAPAPHMTGDRLDSSSAVKDDIVFNGQNALIGHYESSTWYQLQMILNTGSRKSNENANTSPIDWSYHFLYLNELHFANEVFVNDSTTEPQSLRYIQSMIKAMQSRHSDEVGPGQIGGWQMRYLHPWLYYSRNNPSNTELFDALNTYDTNQPTLRKTILDAMLNSFLDIVRNDDRFSLDMSRSYHYDNNPHQRWPRPSDGGGKTPYNRYRLENTNHQLSHINSFSNHTHANTFYTLIPELKDINVDTTLLQELVDWCKEAWPGNNDENLVLWDALLN